LGALERFFAFAILDFGGALGGLVLDDAPLRDDPFEDEFLDPAILRSCHCGEATGTPKVC
jgi:hypothetical protein